MIDQREVLLGGNDVQIGRKKSSRGCRIIDGRLLYKRLAAVDGLG